MTTTTRHEVRAKDGAVRGKDGVWRLPEEKRKAVATDPTDLNRLRLERMFAQFDKPMRLPEPPKERGPPQPRENRNMMGSTAGAGSGEFHTYRGYARRENARLQYIERKGVREDAEQDFQAKLESARRQDEEKLEKKREKRQRKKTKQLEARKRKKQQRSEGSAHSPEDSSGEEESAPEDSTQDAAQDTAEDSVVAEQVFTIGRA